MDQSRPATSSRPARGAVQRHLHPLARRRTADRPTTTYTCTTPAATTARRRSPRAADIRPARQPGLDHDHVQPAARTQQPARDTVAGLHGRLDDERSRSSPRPAPSRSTPSGYVAGLHGDHGTRRPSSRRRAPRAAVQRRPSASADCMPGTVGGPTFTVTTCPKPPPGRMSAPTPVERRPASTGIDDRYPGLLRDDAARIRRANNQTEFVTGRLQRHALGLTPGTGRPGSRATARSQLRTTHRVQRSAALCLPDPGTVWPYLHTTCTTVPIGPPAARRSRDLPGRLASAPAGLRRHPLRASRLAAAGRVDLRRHRRTPLDSMNQLDGDAMRSQPVLSVGPVSS